MLAGRSPHTIDNYQYVLSILLTQEPNVDAWDLALVESGSPEPPAISGAACAPGL
jgi:hypothetical protein